MSADIAKQIVAAANYPGMFTELFGYVTQACDENAPIDPRLLHDYMRELKHKYVTEPIKTALAENREQTRDN